MWLPYEYDSSSVAFPVVFLANEPLPRTHDTAWKDDDNHHENQPQEQAPVITDLDLRRTQVYYAIPQQLLGKAQTNGSQHWSDKGTHPADESHEQWLHGEFNAQNIGTHPLQKQTSQYPGAAGENTGHDQRNQFEVKGVVAEHLGSLFIFS